jgi:hypothetical protein
MEATRDENDGLLYIDLTTERCGRRPLGTPPYWRTWHWPAWWRVGRLNDARPGLWENPEKTATRSVPAVVPAGYQIWNPYPTRRNPLGINLSFTPTLVIP